MLSPRTILNRFSSNRWIAAALLAGAVLLLALVALTFDRRSAPLAPLHHRPDPVDRLVPVSRVEHLSASLSAPALRFLTNGAHPFHTLHFKPPPPPPQAEPTPPPAPAPPPPPPPRKVVLVYNGVYQTAEGQSRAFLKVDDQLSVLPLGGKVVKDWLVSEIGRQKLTLTNSAAQMTVLEFNREKTIEVPAE